MKQTHYSDLDLVAECHISAFPDSLSSAIGKRYVVKMLTWYLNSDRKFLFHYVQNGEVLGYCGGMYSDELSTETSTSGMLQNSMQEAFYGILRKPWLLFHAEMMKKYPLIIKNIKRKLFGVSVARLDSWKKTLNKIDPYLGLIVIGVSENHQNEGIGSSLIQEFEKYASDFKAKKMSLTVNSNNHSAIRAYSKNGWSIADQNGPSTQMIKHLT